MADTVLADIGHCIYCGDRKGPFFREHAIAYALGGNHVLLHASCKPCEDITKKIEGHVCRSMLGPARVQLDYQTRNPKDRKKPFKVKFTLATGEDETVEVPPEQVPANLFLPKFFLPGIIRGVPPTAELQMDLENSFGRLLNPEGMAIFDNLRQYSTGAPRLMGFEPWTFALMIAKIAHCSAMARYHEEAFVPFLPNIIRTGQGYLPHFIGTDDSPAPVIPDRINDVNTGLISKPCGELVFVKIQLFSNFGAPVYVAIAGMLTAPCSRVEPHK